MKLLLLAVCVLPAFAIHAQGRRAADAAALEAQIQAAEAEGAANANRPGDEELTCQQLQDEIVAMAQSSEFQGALQPLAAQGQAQQAQVAEAQQQVEEQTQGRRRGGFGGGGGGLFRSLAQGAATAALPNAVGASGQQAAAMAQAAEMQRQAAQNQEQIFDAAAGVADLAGMAQRGERVMALAQAKKCEWLNGDPLSTPAAAPQPPADGGRRR